VGLLYFVLKNTIECDLVFQIWASASLAVLSGQDGCVIYPVSGSMLLDNLRYSYNHCASQPAPPIRQQVDAAYRYVAVAGAARHGVNNKTKQ
jgi:hypothetical protein